MSKPDEAHRQTDAQLAKLERRVARVYQEARDDLQKTAEDYFERFQERDEEMKALIGTVQNGRKWTANDYKQWRLNQIARGKRFEALRDKMAERYTKANETAMSYVNDRTPGIYSLNRNYGAYLIDKATGGALTVGPDGQTLNADFILFDEQTVKRLIAEAPDVMPYYPPERAVRRGIDLAYGKSQITKNVTSGVLRGLSVKEMADSLQERIQTMERNGAIRAVRTAVTAAQNAGRMDSYRAAGEMGIKLKKRWLATLDGRTRHSHRRLDGETRDTDEAFSNGCLYPGDPRGAPHETYNCRCTLIADLPDFDLSPGQRRAKGATADAEDKSSVVIADMTYSQWAGWVKSNRKKIENSLTTAYKSADNEFLGLTEQSNSAILSTKAPENALDEETKRICNEVIPTMNTTVLVPRQKIHRVGTKEYLDRQQQLAKKGQFGPSYVTISDEEILEIVNQYKGTGKIRVKNGKWDNEETIIENEKIIGVAVNNLTGAKAETSVFRIHYSNKGVHIVPDYPSKKVKRS